MTQFIAEICSNHNGSLNRALALIDKAAEIGCDAVKFQLFRIDQLFAPEALHHPKYREMLHARRQWELPLKWLPVLKARCIKRGIKFGVTPFYVGAVEELLPFVDFYKVASYSLLHDDLLKAIGESEKPVILSTGMATVEEIVRAVKVLLDSGCFSPVTVLHCISSYPTSTNETNPGKFLLLQKRMNSQLVKFGWSDHTVNPVTVHYFAGLGAEVIEFHLDLDEQGWEYNIGHCWLPEMVRPIIKAINEHPEWMATNIIASPAREAGYSESEQRERLWRADPSDGLRPVMEERGRLR